ncbi:MAG: hypothetical protein H8D67_28490 [Deltaproteobacteria bacterium]|nr:hypothetical protein [Deltaproteobacteria bacterium]
MLAKSYRIYSLLLILAAFTAITVMTVISSSKTMKELSQDEMKVLAGGEPCAVKKWEDVCNNNCVSKKKKFTYDSYRGCVAENDSGKSCAWDYESTQNKCNVLVFSDNNCTQYNSSYPETSADVDEWSSPNCENILP